MALVKKHKSQAIEELVTFDSLEEAVEFFRESDDFDEKSSALDQIAKFDGGPDVLVKKLIDKKTTKEFESRIAAILSNMPTEDAPIEEVMNLLKLDNAFTRNLGISILRDYGEAIKYYIVKFMIGDDRDLRIFAINVLGDVNFSESRDMLIELLEKEDDINVAMTAVDYMSEIGQEEDIKLLDSLKTRFDNDPYVVFSVDNAIKMIKG